MVKTTNELHTDLASLDQATLDRYEEYFGRIRPTTDRDVMRRFLFAYLSIQTSWQMNVRLYLRLKDLAWLDGTEEALRRVFLEVRTGLHNRRPALIWRFGQLWRSDPAMLRRIPGESWEGCRDRLCRALPGLGNAKVGFAIELCWPEADCVCLDRHMLHKFFGRMADALSSCRYRELERRFCRACKGRKPGLVRMAIWDRMKGQPNPAYWADCLAA